MSKKLHLGLFLFVPGSHFGGWRHPDAEPEGDVDFNHYLKQVQTAERGLFDTVFFQDSSAVIGSEAIKSGERERAQLGRPVHLDPASLLPALAVLTEKIGLVATATTTYNEPFHIARRFATIDHISKGRAGWNLVTSQIEDEAANFGLDAHVPHAERYRRAEEFLDVVAGLWDGWEDGALLRDKARGIYYDIDKLHFLDHEGEFFKVRGPLNIPRPPQGRPIVSQAGSSEAGMELAARTADVVFTAQISIEQGRAFRKDLHARMAKYGREPHELKVLPGILPIVGRTDQEARALSSQLASLLPDRLVRLLLARHAGDVDLESYPLDGPLPELGITNSAKGRQAIMVDLARKHNFTIREVANYFGTAGGHLITVGSPQTIADTMQEWLETGAADGFNLMFPYYPTPLDQFVDLVVPELQKRGIYRTAYEGHTLRDSFGLSKPASRYQSGYLTSPQSRVPAELTLAKATSSHRQG